MNRTDYWHGTNAVFHQFDLGMCGNCDGSGHGNGIYLAEVKEDARSYAEYASFRNKGQGPVVCLVALSAPERSIIDAKTKFEDIPPEVAAGLKKEFSLDFADTARAEFQDVLSGIQNRHSREKEYDALRRLGVKAIINIWDDGLAKKGMIARVLDPACVEVVHHEKRILINGGREYDWIVA